MAGKNVVSAKIYLTVEGGISAGDVLLERPRMVARLDMGGESLTFSSPVYFRDDAIVEARKRGANDVQITDVGRVWSMMVVKRLAQRRWVLSR